MKQIDTVILILLKTGANHLKKHNEAYQRTNHFHPNSSAATFRIICYSAPQTNGLIRRCVLNPYFNLTFALSFIFMYVIMII